MPMKPKEMVKFLKRHGFIEICQNGTSHLKLYNAKTNTTVIVPMHNKDLSKGMEHKILKEAGINREGEKL
ncbi:MAG: type II toxin-antitoxin system HicA family toxin [Bacilli bacterium]|nr:type II toxin-antitoxin system HicA family toxin [Bacilli bacterium]